ncbi:YkvA family protein [Alkalihalobacillus sp. AL-G]|uniref:YkvA family protein n=1 Tax=Alkalihalobacillus sp. AL-G TaxID=2926399 RepID=UPI00272C2848|nr:YkvA family protein [Alkalihalobacillus sp. AL-G]WLD94080.1 YkvA family protein [Alkalihalobacillus sp. AL-G]
MWRKIKLFFYFKKMVQRARTLIRNREETGEMVRNVRAKLNKKDIRDSMSGFLDRIQALIRLVDQYRLGNYRDISKKSAVLVVAGLLYFLSPIDAIPDILVGIGLIDDLAIITYIWKTLDKEVKHFLEWEKETKQKEGEGSQA